MAGVWVSIRRVDANTEPNPVDLDAAAERAEEAVKAAIAAEAEARQDLARVLSDPAGRKRLRHELREAGFDIDRDSVQTVFRENHGTMCFLEGLRVQALRIVWPMIRGVALGEIPIGDVRLLFDEGTQ